jgi:hypothetical protein
VADQNINPVGCLGRVLTILGVTWLGIVVLGGIGILSDVGISEGFFAGAFGSAIPGVLLLWAGRALRRRARALDAQPPTLPVPTPPRPTAPPATPAQVKPAPKPPQPKAVPVSEPSPADTPADLPPPLKPPPAKTSRELIEEARKKWGTPRT